MMLRSSLLLWLVHSAFAAEGHDGVSHDDINLLHAAGQHSVPKVTQALANGANPNVQQPHTKETPLMISVANGFTDVIDLLLKRTDVDRNIPDKEGMTPAHRGAMIGRADVMRLLQKHGIDVANAFHVDGLAPLHRACQGKEPHHTDVVRFLRDEAGVDINNLRTKRGRSCRDLTENQMTIALLSGEHHHTEVWHDPKEL